MGAHYNQNWQTLFIFADLDADYDVDGNDLAILQPNMGQAGAWEDGDLDADGFVTLADRDLLESMFGLALAVAA